MARIELRLSAAPEKELARLGSSNIFFIVGLKDFQLSRLLMILLISEYQNFFPKKKFPKTFHGFFYLNVPFNNTLFTQQITNPHVSKSSLQRL